MVALRRKAVNRRRIVFIGYSPLLYDTIISITPAEKAVKKGEKGNFKKTKKVEIRG
jgi:hypothetical protein